MFVDILCSKAYFPTFFLNICGSAAVSRGVARGLRSAAPGALLRPRGPRHHILLPGLQGYRQRRLLRRPVGLFGLRQIVITLAVASSLAFAGAAYVPLS